MNAVGAVVGQFAFAAYNGAMKRRIFLQSGAVYGTALGLGQLLWSRPAEAIVPIKWGKFAVLLGVDRYPQASLKGCVTDVELQANLLQTRFEFPPENIVRLTNQAATIDGLKQALANLRRRIKPDDLLVLHFSGKGTLAAGPALEPTLLLTGDEPLRLTDLALILKGSGTKQVITVLDTAFQGADRALPGNQRVRSLGARPDAATPIQAVVLPGMVIAAHPTEVEIDAADFSLGQLTDGLTQALWQATSPSTFDLTPWGTVTGTKREQQFLNGLLAERSRPRTIGALLTVDPSGLAGTVWLGGLPAAQVARLNPPALLQTEDGQTLQVLGRQGLCASVGLLSRADQPAPPPLSLATPIAEQLRLLPRDLAVDLAIDPSLSKVERIDAVSAFASLANVSTHLLSDGPADYILAKIQDPPRYLLLGQERQSIATATSESGTAVKTMVKRFGPIVEALYVDKVLGLLENRSGSRLALTVAADCLTPKPRRAFAQSTAVVSDKSARSPLPDLPVGTQLRYRATNQSFVPLYWLLVGWNSRHETYVVLPPPARSGARIDPGATMDLPFREPSADWVVRGPLGLATVYAIASDRPFTQTATALQIPNSAEAYLYPLTQPLGVIQAVMQDLSAPGFETGAAYGLDMARYVVMPLQYQVV
jgi:Caspase domain/Domain of unknown function (DUF4384)